MKKISLYNDKLIDDKSQYLQDAIEGKKVAKLLEERFCDYVGSQYAIATCNETAALHLSMMAIDLKRGDKILCSVNTYPNVPEVIRHFDAEPIFVDIDEDDYNLDLNELEKFLAKNKSKKLKGVIVSHIAGQPTDLDRLFEIAQKYEILVIEDANDAMGATYDGQKIGSFAADITTFSFNTHRRFSTFCGGVITSHNEELIERARLVGNNAIVESEWDEEGSLGYIYNVVDIGLEYSISDVEAAFCLDRLEKVDEGIKHRQKIAKIYDSELAGVPHIETPLKKRDHIYTKYIIKVDKNRDSFARELYKRGIETGLHYIPLHLLTYYKQKYNLRVNDYPKALRNYQQILSLPIHEGMSEEDAHYVCEQIKEVAKSRA